MKKFIRDGLVMCLVLICSISVTAEAANTLFEVPTMGLPVDNLIYENGAHTIQITDWPHGTEANIISGGSMEGAIAEVNSNVTPSGGKSIISIYTNGADISGGATDAIAGAGWSRMAFYYYDYMVEGDAAGGLGSQSPRCAFVEDATVKAELEKRGYDGQYEMISVQGWNAPNAYVTMYEGESLFGNGSHFDVYKYVEEDNSFIKLSEQGFYGSNYLGLFYVQGDGVYIATTKALTGEQMAPQAVSEETTEQEKTDDNAITGDMEQASESEKGNWKHADTITSSDGKIFWHFNEKSDLTEFMPEAAVEYVRENEVSVSFTYDGELPSEARVTIYLPKDMFEDGTMLYFYYCSPEEGGRKLVDSNVCDGDKVTFNMSHCSDYIITSEPGKEESGNALLLIGMIMGVAALGTVVGFGLARKLKARRSLGL